MRKYLLTAVAAAAIATPAVARDNSGYLGLEGGILLPKDQDADAFIDYDVSPPADVLIGDAFGIDYKKGYDVDVIGGYDFGMFRLEGELGYKRAKLDKLEVDSAFLTAVNSGGGTSIDDDFDLNGHVSVLSGMVNALLDVGGDSGFGAYLGGGFGRARVKTLGESDSAWAYQGIAGVRAALSDQIDVGLKYRYFRTRRLDFGDAESFDAGNAIVTTDFEDRFRSHSLLLSLIYNFAPPAPPPPPPAPPVEMAPPPPPPPATQTCADGSVILATDSCPLPPPPPPPPPPEPERG